MSYKYEAYDPYYDDRPEVEKTYNCKMVTARKARWVGCDDEIKPGDRVLVTSGFYYEVDGPRTSYFRDYRRASKGPGWAN
jgi:hypothetical protein